MPHPISPHHHRNSKSDIGDPLSGARMKIDDDDDAGGGESEPSGDGGD